MKFLSMFFISMVAASSSFASVCILANSGNTGSYLACDGVDKTSTLKKADSVEYIDMSAQLNSLMIQGYKVISQSSSTDHDGSGRTVWTLVK